MKTIGIMLALLTLCASLGVQAEVYRWTDKSGKVYYSDNPPPEVEAQPRRLHDSRIEQEKLPFETRKAAERFPLVLYTSENCKEACVQARSFLGKRKLPFTEQSLLLKEDHEKALARLGKKELMVPALTVGDKLVEGFEASSWTSAIDYAGYPK